MFKDTDTYYTQVAILVCCHFFPRVSIDRKKKLNILESKCPNLNVPFFVPITESNRLWRAKEGILSVGIKRHRKEVL